MACRRLTYQNFSFLAVVHRKKRVSEEKKCVNYYPFGLLQKGYHTYTNPNGNDVAKRFKFGGKEYDESLGLDTYDFGARNYNPNLGRWMNIDPLAEKMRRHSPYNYAFDNPIYFIDPDGMAPMSGQGDFIAENGKKIGTDGIDDGKVYVIKTTKTDFDSGVSSDGISKTQAKATKKFIKKNNGNTKAFQKNSIAYDNSVEIEGSMETRQLMVNIVNQDNGEGGTSDANNREYGGVVNNDGTITESPTGAVANPKIDSHAGITHTIDSNTKSTFHSHPSGEVVEGTENNNGGGTTIMIEVSTKIYSFQNAPSEIDINGSTRTNYVFSRATGKVYIYSGNGVKATLPQKSFVTPRN